MSAKGEREKVKGVIPVSWFHNDPYVSYEAFERVASEYDAAIERVELLENTLRACERVWDYFSEFETFGGCGEYLEAAMDATDKALKGGGEV